MTARLILKLTFNVESLKLRTQFRGYGVHFEISKKFITDFLLETPFIQTFEALFYSEDFPVHHKLYLQPYQIILVLENYSFHSCILVKDNNL